MSTITELDLAIQQVDSLLSQLQVNSKVRPSAEEPKSIPSKGASRPAPPSKWVTLLAHLTALFVADSRNAGKKVAGAASTQPKDTGSAAGAGAGSQPAIHELFAKAQLQVCNRFAAISLQTV